MLVKLAIDWRGSQPKLVSYFGSVEENGVTGAVIATPGNLSSTVDHRGVFWLGMASPRGVGIHRLVLQVGQA
jgi:hypothetical protein